MEDEWYFHLRFLTGIDPVLAAVPPATAVEADGPRTGNPAVRAAVASGVPQVLAWTYRSPGGARGFGFTGGHFLRNWYDSGFRRLVLNGIVWTAGIPVPADGVPTGNPKMPLHASLDEAIARGDVADVQRHLERDPASVNGSERSRLRPLHQAILRRQADVARVLLERGANPRLADAAARSPLQMAVERGDVALVNLLLNAGAEANVRDKAGWTPLHHAGAKNQLAIARRLLEGGADARLLSELGGTALHEAAVSGGPELLQLLIDRGADPSIVSKTGVTALDLARQYGNAAGASFLDGVTPRR
jgi:ankyrin repeat protein